jgi:glycosyltransferase involved in cell wall biosynthesis
MSSFQREMALSVCVGIPVYNEEKNIYKLLKSIIFQKSSIYRLKQIIVVNDGSTDKTLHEIERFKKQYKDILDRKLVEFYVIDLPNNLGMANAINILTKMTSCDVLVIVASDVILSSTHSIEELIREFTINKAVGYVAGWRVIRSRYNNLVIRSLKFSDAFLEMLGLTKQRTIFVAGGGGILALRKAVYKGISLPRTVRIDALLYLYCISKGYQFKFNPRARVIYEIREPLYYSWYIKTQKRVHSIPKEHEQLFPNCSLEYRKLPNPFLLAKIFAKSFARYPIDGLCYVIVKLFYIIASNIKHIEVSPTWRR